MLKIIFLLALGLQVAAWLLAGGRPGLRAGTGPRTDPGKIRASRTLRRCLLIAGVLAMCGYAGYTADYLLLAGQLALALLLWRRVS